MKKLWFGFFVLMYPILITFSLVYTGLLLIFSTLSRVISFLAGSLTPRSQAKARGVVTPGTSADELPEVSGPVK